MNFLLKIGDVCIPSIHIKYILDIRTEPVKRKLNDWKQLDNYIDITHGKKTRCVVITSDYIFASPFSSTTLIKKLNSMNDNDIIEDE